MSDVPVPRDKQDRLEMGAVSKLIYICDQAKKTFGRDPRAGGFSFVGRPLVIKQAYIDTPVLFRVLHKAVVVGMKDADVLFYWERVPFRVRHHVKNDDLWVMRDDMIQDSILEDRQYASQLRMDCHRGVIMVGGN